VLFSGGCARTLDILARSRHPLLLASSETVSSSDRFFTLYDFFIFYLHHEWGLEHCLPPSAELRIIGYYTF
jgi:hypothetical protein